MKSGINRDVVIISCIFALSNTASGSLSPIWPIYIVELGATMTELGLIFSVASIAASALQIPSGLLSDRFGRKRLHAVGVLLGVIPPLMYGHAGRWLELLPLSVLAGISTGLTTAIRWTVVADISPDEMAKAYSWNIAGMLTGVTVGPFLGGFISDLYGIKSAFIACFLLYSATFLLSIMLRETRSKPEEEPPMPPNDRRPLLKIALIFSATNIIQGFGFYLTTPVSPIFMTTRFEVDYTQLGIIYALGSGLPSILVQFPGGKMADMYSRRKLIISTIIFSSPFIATIPLSRNLIDLVLSLAINSLILNIAWPAYQALMMDSTPPNRRGFINGISATTMWIGMTAGSALSGFLWESFGASSPFYTAAIVFPLSALPFIWLGTAGQIGEKYCPKCYVFRTQKENFCIVCGTRLKEIRVRPRER